MQTSFPLLNLNANTGDHYFSAPNTNNNGSKGMTEEEKKEFEDTQNYILRLDNDVNQLVEHHEYLDQEVKELFNNDVSLGEELSKLQESALMNYYALTNVDSQIQNSIQSANKTIQSFKQQFTEQEDHIEAIGNDQTQLQVSVTSAVEPIKSQISDVEDRIKAWSNKQTELTQKIDAEIKFNADVQSNTSAIAQITQDVNADIQQLSTAQTQFQTQVEKTVDDKVTTAVQSIQSQIDNSSTEQNNNVADITTDFNSKLSNVNAQIQQLSTVQTQLKEGVNSTVESNIKYQLAILEEKFTTTINAQIEQGIQTLEKSVQQNVTNFLTVQDPSTTDPV